MTRRTLIRGNWALFVVGVAFVLGAFAVPTDFQIILLALGLGSITFCGFSALLLIATAKKSPKS